VGFLQKRKKQARVRGNPRREMTFLEHLNELRVRLIICIVSIILTTVVGGVLLARPTLDLIKRPFITIKTLENPSTHKGMLLVRLYADGTVRVLIADIPDHGDLAQVPVRIILPNLDEISWNKEPERPMMLALTPFAVFLALIKVALILGIIFAMPIWLYQVWLFVAPAMMTKERRVVRPVLASGLFLFPMGVAFAYGMLYVVMPFALGYAEKVSGVRLMPDLTKYLSFAINFMLAFGVVFETPLVLILLVRMGVVSTATLMKSRPYAVVMVCILSAVLTPQDPFSMIAMAIPMLVLFELSLWISAVVEKKIQAAERRERKKLAAG
jgi:sec-independent protein translocase protein TatC